MTGVRTATALLALTLCLGGCASAPPITQDRFFRLDPRPLSTPLGRPAPVVLMVTGLGSQGFLGGRPVVFRTSAEPLVAQRYDNILWEEPPTRLMASALVTAIRDAQVVEFVVVPADRARADYLLAGEMERFEHLPTDQPPQVAVAFNLSLVRAGDRGSVASRGYSGTEPVNGDTPAAMVDAFNRLAARLVAEAVRDLQADAPRMTGLAP